MLVLALTLAMVNVSPPDACPEMTRRALKLATELAVDVGVECEKGLLEIRLSAPNDLAVLAHVVSTPSGWSYEVLAELDDGEVSWTVIEDETGGHITFAAATEHQHALAVYSRTGAQIAVDGDLAATNAELVDVLEGSTSWPAAHMLALAAADLWDGLAEHEEALLASLRVAVPPPEFLGKWKGILSCGFAAAACTAAGLGVVPAGPACITHGGTCLILTACKVSKKC